MPILGLWTYAGNLLAWWELSCSQYLDINIKGAALPMIPLKICKSCPEKSSLENRLGEGRHLLAPATPNQKHKKLDSHSAYVQM